MGKLLIGPIETKTPFFIPSPEPLVRLAQLSSLDVASSSTSKSSSTTDKDDYKLLPGHRMALLKQKQQIDRGQKVLESYAMTALEKDYHGDPKAFINGEQEKYKNGQGYYAMKEGLLAAENLYKTNYSTAKQEYDIWEKSNSKMMENGADGLYFLDPKTNSRVRSNVKDGEAQFFKNIDWINYQTQRLGIDTNGVLERGVWPSTFAPGQFQKEFIQLAQLGAWNPQTKELTVNGRTIVVKSNSESLSKLPEAVNSLLSQRGKADLLNEFYQFKDSNTLTKDEAKGLTKAEQDEKLFSLFVANKLDAGINLLERTSRIDREGSGGSGSSSDKAEALGPIGNWVAKNPTAVRKRDWELTYDNSGNLIWDKTSTKLNQITPFDTKWVNGANENYYQRILRGQGVKPETMGDYFWANDGTPNSMNVFKGTKSYILSIENFQENRTPMSEIVMNDGKPENGYGLSTVKKRADYLKNGKFTGDIQKRAELEHNQIENTIVVRVAVDSDDVDKVLEKMRTVALKGSKKGKIDIDNLSSSDLETMSLGADKDSKRDYKILTVELPAGDMRWFEEKSLSAPVTKAAASTNQYIVDDYNNDLNSSFYTVTE